MEIDEETSVHGKIPGQVPSVSNDNFGTSDKFYLKYYAGHQGKFGHEFLEFELIWDPKSDTGRLHYANNSNYRDDTIIKKKAPISWAVILEAKRIIEESEIMRESDVQWPKKNSDGKQELEIKIGKEHVAFETCRISSFQDVQNSEDPEGLEVFYYLIQDLKALVLSLISLHLKIKPI